MSHSIFDMTDRVALVTGAASGMGKAMAVGFAESGADLMLADVNEPGAQETAHEIESLGRRAIPVRCDVSDVDQVRGMFSRLDVGIRPDRRPGQRRRRHHAGQTRGPHPGSAPGKHAVSGHRALLQLPGGRPADARGGQGQHHQYRLSREPHRDRARPRRLQHRHGRRRPDDPGTQHGVEQPRRARERDSAGPGHEPVPGKTTAGRTPHGRYLAGRHSGGPVRRAAGTSWALPSSSRPTHRRGSPA